MERNFVCFLSVLFYILVFGLSYASAKDDLTSFNLELQIQGAKPRTENTFQCSLFPVPSPGKQLWMKGFSSLGDPTKAYHTTLIGCQDKYSNQTEGTAWDCSDGVICDNFQEIFTWNQYSPAAVLPPGVGFKIGDNSTVKYLMLMVHYEKPLKEDEVDYQTGLSLKITEEKQQYMAGLLLLTSRGFSVPPNETSYGVDVNCLVGTPTNLTIFASQVHTHSLGYAVSGYKLDNKTLKMDEIYRGNPNWPAPFYQTRNLVEIQPMDIVAAMCSFDSTSKVTETESGVYIGGVMCEMYFMYYTDPEKGKSYMQCVTRQIPVVSELYPPDVHTPLPRNEFLEGMEAGLKGDRHYTIHYDGLFTGKQHSSTGQPEVDIRDDQEPVKEIEREVK